MYIGISHENKKKLRAMFIHGNDAMAEATTSYIAILRTSFCIKDRCPD